MVLKNKEDSIKRKISIEEIHEEKNFEDSRKFTSFRLILFSKMFSFEKEFKRKE